VSLSSEILEVAGSGCFAAGTRLLTPTGSKAIEEFVPGDAILSRSEDDPVGPVEASVVEEVFVRTLPLITVDVDGKVIRTTARHPFFAVGKGWTQAAALRPGDRLLSHNGATPVVRAVAESGDVETVYNMRVAEYHTYFVSGDAWGFSVWAHNVCKVQRLTTERPTPSIGSFKAHEEVLVTRALKGQTHLGVFFPQQGADLGDVILINTANAGRPGFLESS
jgi:hypothetical protein